MILNITQVTCHTLILTLYLFITDSTVPHFILSFFSLHFTLSYPLSSLDLQSNWQNFKNLQLPIRRSYKFYVYFTGPTSFHPNSSFIKLKKYIPNFFKDILLRIYVLNTRILNCITQNDLFKIIVKLYWGVSPA